MSTGRPHHYGHLLQDQKESLTLYTSFHYLINVHSSMSGADNPRGQILMSTETSCHFGHLLQFSKKNIYEVWFYTIFFLGLTTPLGQNFDVNRNILSLRSVVASFKKISLKSDFIQFFMIIYMYIALGQGQTAPWGQSFDVNRNVLSLHSFVASLKKNVFEVWFYTIFFMI